MAYETTPGTEEVLALFAYDVQSGLPYGGAAPLYGALTDTTTGLWWDALAETWGARPTLGDHLAATVDAEDAGSYSVTIPAAATLGLTGHNLRLKLVSGLTETLIVSEFRNIRVRTLAGNVIVNPQDVTPGQMTHLQELVQTVIQGDSPTLTYTLNYDCTGFTAWFGAKRRAKDAAYSISVREVAFAHIATGALTIPLTTGETAALALGTHQAEVELRDGVDVFTVIRLKLFVDEQII